ncbi:uncharacterized protein LOC110848348 isoform X2 [Folsomia candida]|nr:uncharacterized protein LOC110848348 isoform X2 [Folsomia candida]
MSIDNLDIIDNSTNSNGSGGGGESNEMSEITTAAFLSKGSDHQFKYVLGLYDEALKIKAESKSKKPQELIKLDQWYQKELPVKIKSRGKDPYINHDELVTCMRWKLARGKFRPKLKELVTMNSPRVVENETKKAFRALFKKDDLAAAIQYMCNLKGVGPSTASSLLTAAAPDKALFMADECIAAVPELEGIDYTLKEYLELFKHVQQAVARLGGSSEWTPHKIELALWTHNVLLTLKPDLLKNIPGDGEGIVPPIGVLQEDSLASTISSADSKILSEDGNSNLSNAGSVSDATGNEDSNLGTGDDSNSVDAFVQSHKKNGQSDGQMNGTAKKNDIVPSSADVVNHHSEDANDNEGFPAAKKMKLDEPLPVPVPIESA